MREGLKRDCILGLLKLYARVTQEMAPAWVPRIMILLLWSSGWERLLCSTTVICHIASINFMVSTTQGSAWIHLPVIHMMHGFSGACASSLGQVGGTASGSTRGSFLKSQAVLWESNYGWTEETSEVKATKNHDLSAASLWLTVSRLI